MNTSRNFESYFGQNIDATHTTTSSYDDMRQLVEASTGDLDEVFIMELEETVLVSSCWGFLCPTMQFMARNKEFGATIRKGG